MRKTYIAITGSLILNVGRKNKGGKMKQWKMVNTLFTELLNDVPVIYYI